MDLSSPSLLHVCSSISPKKSQTCVGCVSLPRQTLKSPLTTHFNVQRMASAEDLRPRRGRNHSAPHAQTNHCMSKDRKWWENGLNPNMKGIQSAVDLVKSLLEAGETLVVVDFFSPRCGGCRALHPKICQFAEQNPEVQFLHVNYEEHKSMCCSLNVHVLPFIRMYRGAQGRICSFSCTNATIEKFKDALAKHSTERCSLGPARGLEESELLAMAANMGVPFNYWIKQALSLTPPQETADRAIGNIQSVDLKLEMAGI